MKAHVLGVRGTDNKIVGGIIRAVEIAMMNLLSLRQSTAECRFGNDDVLEDIAFAISARVAGHQDFFVAFFENERLLAGISAASHRAVFGFLVAWRAFLAAVLAMHGCCRPHDTRRGFGVVQTQVVLSAIAFPEMSRSAAIDTASFRRPLRLPLLRKSFATLPQAVASHVAKRANCARMNLPGYLRAALAAMIFIHDVIIPISDGNHYALSPDGKRA